MRLTARETVRFSIMVGLAAILVDAAIAHGLFWENDPYWTYWITKTFLITTVFALGTSFFGIGLVKGVGITAVHTLILEIYYQWLAPVGLPQEPEWLDFNHLWTTGLPAHFLAIFAGYLIALWVWNRRLRFADIDSAEGAVAALVASVIAIVLDGVITHGVLLREFPGLTYFVTHLLIAAVISFAWITYVGLDLRGWIVGSVLLGLIWVTYDMYLGPLGLPLHTPRYLGYVDLWTKALPGGILAALGGLFLIRRMRRFATMRPLVKGSACLIFALLVSQTSRADSGLKASASASGNGAMVVGNDPTNMQSTQPLSGSIDVQTDDQGNRWSHVQNTDGMKVEASFVSGGSKYQVKIDKPMPRHPMGRYTTWFGVVYNHEMHGKTGIGSAKIPKVKPEIALWGWAEVVRDGKIISKMAPAHVMVMTTGDMPGVMLEVDTEDKTLPEVPGGFITAMWGEVKSIEMPKSQVRTRNAAGWLALIGLVAGFWWLNVSETRDRTLPTVKAQ
jgi:hypothetical protein